LGKQTYDDQLITQYLLGRLSEEEVERLDALSFEEDEFAYRLQVVEDDLVDAYANGDLTGQNLESFNSHYLLTASRREKVKFAMAFHLIRDRALPAGGMQSIQERAALSPEAEKRMSLWRSLRAAYSVLSSQIRWGLVPAAMLMLLFGGWLLVDNFRLRNRLEQANVERPALNSGEQELRAELERQRSANSNIEKELERTRDRLSNFEQQQAKSQKPALPRDLAIVHYDLSPQTRSIDSVTTVSILPETDYVSFQLELEPGEVHSYRAELKTQSGDQVIWRSGKLTARPIGKGGVVNVSIPAKLLVPRWYILELSAISGSAAEVEAGYPFRVEKK
jgi:hypothetical protein